MSDYVLGIDLGTSTTSVSVVQDGMATVIPIIGEDVLQEIYTTVMAGSEQP